MLEIMSKIRGIEPPHPPPEASGALTSVDHWDAGWTSLPTKRFWSPFDVATRDIHKLLSKHIGEGDRVLEIGYAPGKLLAWLGMKLRARVAGVDYSTSGSEIARRFFSGLGLSADLRNENVFETTFAPGSFDTVYSNGVIEHFDDPRPIVAKHVELVRSGGKVIVFIPNYGGFLGRLQQRIDPENLMIHNLTIMSPAGLRALFQDDDVSRVDAFYFGRVALSGLSLRKVMPAPLALGMQHAVGLLSGIVPIPAGPLAPLVVAIATKR
jgi:SAM-dependent methyltransferase